MFNIEKKNRNQRPTIEKKIETKDLPNGLTLSACTNYPSGNVHHKSSLKVRIDYFMSQPM